MKGDQLSVIRDASPKGRRNYRHWLTRVWDSSRATALVIGINPNWATDTEDDAMTQFLVRHLQSLKGDYSCGGYVLVNCCDLRERDPKKLKTAKMPCSLSNLATIQRYLSLCDFVVASWGTTDYGKAVTEIREQISVILRNSGKRIICFSPSGAPIYCSQTNKNSQGRWSDTPVTWSGAQS